MAGNQTNGCWHELARVRAPLTCHRLWTALLDKTEHPERYNPGIREATVLDHDPTVVLRRTVPTTGAPFNESIHHACRDRRVEVRRHGRAWSTAQAVVTAGQHTWLVYEVSDPAAAAAEAGIDAAWARRTLEHLVRAAHLGVQEPREETWRTF